MYKRSIKCLFLLFTFGICAYAQSKSEIVEPSFSVRAITPNDNYSYWYGYYDKKLTDPSGRYVLSMRTTVEGRTPDDNDIIEIGMTDLKDNLRWIKLGESRAWGWQQGCMLQFIPGVSDEVLWNDREGSRFVARIFNIRSRQLRTLPGPVYTIAPNGKWGLGLDFARLQTRRPGYGYHGMKDTTVNEKIPANNGIYKIDLQTGQIKMLLTLEKIVSVPGGQVDFSMYYNWVNHLLVNPDGTRFIFLHRWHNSPAQRFYTRMFTSDINGDNLYVLDTSGFTSHFIWKDSRHVSVFTHPPGLLGRFYLFTDQSREMHVTGFEKMNVNGHQSYINHTGEKWVVNDTYPNKEHYQTLYLYNEADDNRVDIGKFLSPPGFEGEWRCDLHPWAAPDGKKVFFQSAHEGKRRVYIANISHVTTKR